MSTMRFTKAAPFLVWPWMVHGFGAPKTYRVIPWVKCWWGWHKCGFIMELTPEEALLLIEVGDE